MGRGPHSFRKVRGEERRLSLLRHRWAKRCLQKASRQVSFCGWRFDRPPRQKLIESKLSVLGVGKGEKPKNTGGGGVDWRGLSRRNPPTPLQIQNPPGPPYGIRAFPPADARRRSCSGTRSETRSRTDAPRPLVAGRPAHAKRARARRSQNTPGVEECAQLGVRRRHGRLRRNHARLRRPNQRLRRPRGAGVVAAAPETHGVGGAAHGAGCPRGRRSSPRRPAESSTIGGAAHGVRRPDSAKLGMVPAELGPISANMCPGSTKRFDFGRTRPLISVKLGPASTAVGPKTAKFGPHSARFGLTQAGFDPNGPGMDRSLLEVD